MTIARFIVLVLGSALLLLATTDHREAEAHTSGFPLVRYNPFRLPWPAEVAWDREEGNPPGVNTHFGTMAIDFSGPGNLHGQPVKAVGNGFLAYEDLGDESFGLYARVAHFGGFSSIYAHLDSIGAPGGTITQGTWVGNVGSRANPPGRTCTSRLAIRVVTRSTRRFPASRSRTWQPRTLRRISPTTRALAIPTREPATARFICGRSHPT